MRDSTALIAVSASLRRVARSVSSVSSSSRKRRSVVSIFSRCSRFSFSSAAAISRSVALSFSSSSTVSVTVKCLLTVAPYFSDDFREVVKDRDGPIDRGEEFLQVSFLELLAFCVMPRIFGVSPFERKILGGGDQGFAVGTDVH